MAGTGRPCHPWCSFATVEVNTDVRIGGLLKNLVFSRLPYNAERFLFPAFEKELGRVLKSAQFDIVQLEGLYLMPYVETIRRHSAAKIVYRAHNIEQEIWKRVSQTESNTLKKIVFQFARKAAEAFRNGSHQPLRPAGSDYRKRQGRV